MFLPEKYKQLLGRQSFLPSGLKVPHNELAKISLQEYNRLQVDLERLYYNFSEKDNAFARIAISKDKDFFVITRDSKAMFFIYDKKLNLLTQRVSLEELNNILLKEKSLLMRFDNCKNLYSLKDVEAINAMLNNIINKEKGYSVDDDFDYTL